MTESYRQGCVCKISDLLRILSLGYHLPQYVTLFNKASFSTIVYYQRIPIMKRANHIRISAAEYHRIPTFDKPVTFAGKYQRKGNDGRANYVRGRISANTNRKTVNHNPDRISIFRSFLSAIIDHKGI